jgi:hypothetical protein
MTDQELKDIVASLAVNAQQMREAQYKTDRFVQELGKQIGGLGNKFGYFTEALILPSMERVLHERFGVDLEDVSTRHKRQRGGRLIELDAFGYTNGSTNTAYIVEVKDIVRERHVEQALRIMEEFPDFFPEHREKHLYGIIAGIEAASDVQHMIAGAGLYYADINDNIFRLASPEGFVGKDFRRV